MGELSEFRQVAEMANMLKNAGDFIPSSFKGNAGAIAAAILTGRELGISPMASLRSLYVVNGKVGMSYELIVGQLRRHKYKAYRSHIRLFGRLTDSVRGILSTRSIRRTRYCCVHSGSQTAPSSFPASHRREMDCAQPNGK